ncbi:MAG: ribose 5-phosphate isomerase B [PVC group bacterium]
MDQSRLEKIVDEVMKEASPIVKGPANEVPMSTVTEKKGSVKRIAIGADHGGFPLKEELVRFLEAKGYTVKDMGTDSAAAVDYPDFAEQVARAVASGDCDRGIMIDSLGMASAMAANKVRGIRAAMCYDLTTARSSREHNDANVLTLGGKTLNPSLAAEIVSLWLTVEFAGGRHWPRVNKIMAIERKRK